MDRASKATQIKIYLGKCFRVFKNEHGWKLFISSTIIAVLIAMVINHDQMCVEYQPTRSGVFALVCGCIWIGIFNSIQSVCKERDIIKREYRSGLYISSYIISHVVFEMVICAVESTLVTAIFCTFFSGNLPEFGVYAPIFIELWLSFFFTIFASDALGLMVSSIVKTPNTAMTVMPFVLIIQLVMSGFIFELSGVMEAVAYITVAKWSLNGLCTSLNVNSLLEQNPGDMKYLMMKDTYEKFESSYEFTAGNLIMAHAILIGFILLYMIISIICLRSVDKDKR